MQKVAIYCRLSDEDKNKSCYLEDSESIQNQKSMLYKYAMEQQWEIYRIYSDDDYSGLDSERPEWNQMLKDAEARKFDIILCKSQSRFTRDMELVEKYLHNKFIEWGIRFIGLTDNTDTSNRGNKKQRQIIGLIDEWYCEDVSENIRAVFDVKRKEGKFIGSFAPYGYKKSHDDKNKLVIDENAARIVRMIFNWYLMGYGAHCIAVMLNESGIPCPSKYKRVAGFNYVNSSRNNDSGLWSKTTVKRILKNEIYIGNMVQGKRRKVSYKSKKIVSTGKEQWIRVEDTHEAIVDKGMFYEVQRRIGERQRISKSGQSHIFSTKVRCADCGNSMNKVTVFRGNGRKYSYLRCKVYAASGNKALCTSHSIRLDLLRDIVEEKLREYTGRYLDTDFVAHSLQEGSDTSRLTRKLQSEADSVERQLQQAAHILKSLYLDKVNGKITEELFYELSESISCEKAMLARRRESIKKRMKELNEKPVDKESWVDIVKQYKDFGELTHTMVGEWIDYIEIGEKDALTGEQKVKIHWRF